MHIVAKQYLGLELKSPERAPLLQHIADSVAGLWLEISGEHAPETMNVFVRGIISSLVNPYLENYLLTDTAQELISNIKVGENFDLEILRLLPADEALNFNFLLGPNRFIKCIWNNESLTVIDLSRSAGKIQCASAIASLKASVKDFNTALVGAIQCLIFLKLTEPEMILVAAGKKHGTRKQGHYNASPFPVTIVDSTWNKFIVRTEGFGVSGHFRLQRHGKGNAGLKLVWIKPFLKDGYVRLPKSQTLEEGNAPK